MSEGRMKAGRTQVGHRSDTGRRQVGGISLKSALEWNAESGISEGRFKKSGIQIVFEQKNHGVFFLNCRLIFVLQKYK
jgi:hypothetical protein